MRDIGGSGLDVGRWPYFDVREGKSTAILILTSNRGLCGGFNANLLRLGLKTFQSKVAEGHDVKIHVGGSKGVAMARFEGYELDGVFIDELKDDPQPSDAAFFQKLLTKPFLENLVDEVLVVYPKWITATRQEPTVLRLLPIAPEQ